MPFGKDAILYAQRFTANSSVAILELGLETEPFLKPERIGPDKNTLFTIYLKRTIKLIKLIRLF